MKNKLTPTQPSERITALDFLRGIAVLGILVINIESFSYPDPWSPFKYGFDNPADHVTRFWVYFLFQGKSFGMFTLLFGVGFYIFLERLEKKGLGLKALDIYARRLLWLFVFGVIHAYFIWDGDVLYHYAICGFLLFPFRSFSVKKLFLILLVPVGFLLYNSYESTVFTKNQYKEYNDARAKDASEQTSDEKEKIKIWESKTSEKKADESLVEKPRQTIYQSWVANAEHTKVHRGVIFYHGIFYRTLIMMILGIILYKSSIFSDYRSVKYYWPITISFLFLALVINYMRYYHWSFEYFHPVMGFWKSWLFTFPKESLGLAYVLFFNGLFQKYFKDFKFNFISVTGRMALTNYIFQSIICGLIFYGYGLGRYNEFSRTELLMFVPVIWLIQIGLSFIWMKKFTYGPLEWVWRKLTYKTFI